MSPCVMGYLVLLRRQEHRAQPPSLAALGSCLRRSTRWAVSGA